MVPFNFIFRINDITDQYVRWVYLCPQLHVESGTYDITFRKSLLCFSNYHFQVSDALRHLRVSHVSHRSSQTLQNHDFKVQRLSNTQDQVHMWIRSSSGAFEGRMHAYNMSWISYCLMHLIEGASPRWRSAKGKHSMGMHASGIAEAFANFRKELSFSRSILFHQC